MTENTSTAAPPIVDRDTWLQARNELLVREKAHTRSAIDSSMSVRCAMCDTLFDKKQVRSLHGNGRRWLTQRG